METCEYSFMYEVEDRHWWYRGLHELVVRQIADAGLKAPRMLDAGCGTGKLLTLLRDKGTVAGIDCSDDAIRFCRQRGLAMVTKVNLNDWLPEPSSYDAITSIDVVCCREVVSDVAFFQRAFAALKPHGILILNLPAFASLSRMHDVAVHIRERYRLTPLCTCLQQVGFRMDVATYRLPWLFLVMLGLRLYEAIRRPRTVTSDVKPVPAVLNQILLRMHRVENALIARGVRMPWGSSVFVVARKPEVTGG
jgi:SAM-dependent methyltransferase